MSASPTSARVEPERAPAGDRRGVADARLGDDEPVVRDELAQADGPLGVDVERPQVAVVEADQAGAGRERALELALVVGLDERLEAELAAPASTSRASRLAGWRTASSSTRSAPAARRSGSWTADRRRTPWRGPGRRRRRGPRAGRRPSRRTSAARTGRRSPPRRRPRRRGRGRRCRRPSAAIAPADGERALDLGDQVEAGRGERARRSGAAGARPRRRSMSAPGPVAVELGGDVRRGGGRRSPRRRSARRAGPRAAGRRRVMPALVAAVGFGRGRRRVGRSALRAERARAARPRGPASIVSAARSIPSSIWPTAPATSSAAAGVEQHDVAPDARLAAEDGLDDAGRSPSGVPPASLRRRRALEPERRRRRSRAARSPSPATTYSDAAAVERQLVDAVAVDRRTSAPCPSRADDLGDPRRRGRDRRPRAAGGVVAGRVGQRPEQVERGPDADLARGSGPAWRIAGWKPGANRKANPCVAQRRAGRRRVVVDPDAERVEHVGRARPRRDRPVAVLGDRDARPPPRRAPPSSRC